MGHQQHHSGDKAKMRGRRPNTRKRRDVHLMRLFAAQNSTFPRCGSISPIGISWGTHSHVKYSNKRKDRELLFVANDFTNSSAV